MKTKLKYELIDNQSGRTLLSGPTAETTLLSAAQYCLDYNVPYEDVAYVIIRNGAKVVVIFTATGDELRELIEDERADPYADTTEDDWESDGGHIYFEDEYGEYE